MFNEVMSSAFSHEILKLMKESFLHNVVYSVGHLLSLRGDVSDWWMILPDENLRATLPELLFSIFLRIVQRYFFSTLKLLSWLGQNVCKPKEFEAVK